MKHHLLIDCSYINDSNKGLIYSLEYYAGRLLQGFLQSEDFDVTAIVWKGYESYIDELAGYKVPKILLDGHHYVTPWPVLDRLLGLVSSKIMREVKQRKIDIVLSPYSFGCRLFFPKKYRQHVVVHDLILDNIIAALGKYKSKLWRLYQVFLLKRVPYLISISEATRSAIYSFASKDSTVVYNSLPFNFATNEIGVDGVIGKRYILDINRFAEQKNPETLIRAFSLIRDHIPHYLYLKGHQDNVRFEVIDKLITELNLGGRVIIDMGLRKEGEMRYLYTHADLFVTPSLSEGFGWTPIEAAVLKTPVLISGIDVLKEVTCGKIPTFDPYSPKDLAEKIHHTLQNPPSYDERENLAKFYKERYSLQRQIDQLTKVLLSHLHN